MEIYKNLGGSSNVGYYEIANDGIVVKFLDGLCYKYTYASAEISNVEEMKKLAAQGEGLNSFINKYVKKGYETKW